MKHQFDLTIFFLFLSTLYVSAQQECEFEPIDFDPLIGQICEKAYPICINNLHGYTGELSDVFNPNQQITPLCVDAEPQNTQWIAFSTCQEVTTITITPFNCSNPNDPQVGLQAGIYTSCDPNSNLLCDTDANLNPIVFSFASVPGETYFLFLDGYVGSICEFEITVQEGMGGGTGTGAECTATVEGPDEFCGPFTGTYLAVTSCEDGSSLNCGNPSVPGLDISIDDFICYEWTIEPDTLWEIIGDQNGPEIEIEWDYNTIGITYTISYEIITNPFIDTDSLGWYCCNPGEFTFEPLMVTANPIIENYQTQEICDGDFVSFCGDILTETGVYTCFDVDNCQLDILDLIVKEDFEIIDEFWLCEGSCLVYNSVDYCQPGTYTVGVDQCSELQIILNQLFFYFDEGEMLDCNDPSTIISFDADGPGIVTWYDPDGNVIDTGNDLVVFSEGVYKGIFELDQPIHPCIVEYSFFIEEDFDPPVFSIGAEELSCEGDVADAQVDVVSNVENVEWYEDGDLIGTGTTINLGSGTYNVVATGFNGCTSSQQFEISPPEEILEHDLESTVITCIETTSNLQISANLILDEVIWTSSTGEEYSGENVDVDEIGIYDISIVTESGCEYSDNIMVIENKIYPEFVIENPEMWECNTTDMFITSELLDSGLDVSFSWSTNDGDIISQDSENVTIGSIGTYELIVTENTTGCTYTDNITVINNPNVVNSAEINGEDIDCEGNPGSISLFNIEGGIEPYTTYIDGEIVDLSEYAAQSPGEYEVEIVDGNGCSITKKVTIGEQGLIDGIITGPDYVDDPNEPVTFTADVFADISKITIKWYDDQDNFLGEGLSITIFVDRDMVIRYEVESEEYCPIIRSKPVEYKDDFKVYIPNIYSPNGDGINDLFIFDIWNAEPVVIRMQVFDRWGNKVFDSDVETGDDYLYWDGEFNGEEAIIGVYSYLLTFTHDGGDYRYSGTVTLVR